MSSAVVIEPPSERWGGIGISYDPLQRGRVQVTAYVKKKLRVGRDCDPLGFDRSAGVVSITPRQARRLAIKLLAWAERAERRGKTRT